MQVLLVLINKGRLCIYFCSPVHRSSLGDQDMFFCRQCGKLVQVLPSKPCSCSLGSVICLHSLSLTHTQTHTHTIPLPCPGDGCQAWGRAHLHQQHQHRCLCSAQHVPFRQRFHTHRDAERSFKHSGTRELRCILWCQIAIEITLEHPQELLGAASTHS